MGQEKHFQTQVQQPDHVIIIAGVHDWRVPPDPLQGMASGQDGQVPLELQLPHSSPIFFALLPTPPRSTPLPLLYKSLADQPHPPPPSTPSSHASGGRVALRRQHRRRRRRQPRPVGHGGFDRGSAGPRAAARQRVRGRGRRPKSPMPPSGGGGKIWTSREKGNGP